MKLYKYDNENLTKIGQAKKKMCIHDKNVCTLKYQFTDEILTVLNGSLYYQHNLKNIFSRNMFSINCFTSFIFYLIICVTHRD